MRRISTATRVIDKFGAGKDGFTDGDAVAGLPATDLQDVWFDHVQEEIANVVEAAGLTLDASNRAQLLAAIQSGLTGHGQCRLSVVSTTSLKLSPFNGNRLIINGVSQKIPSAGVTLSNAGLAATTVYYVYAYMNAGVMTLEAVATTHATGTNGVETKSGDATRTLVGMIRTGASSQFLDTASARFCLNWFNRRRIVGATAAVPNYTFTNTSPAEINASLRVEFLCWSDDVPIISQSGAVSQSATASVITQAAVDTVGNTYTPVQQISLPSTYAGPFSGIGGIGGLSEGYHFSIFVGNVTSGTGTLQSIQTDVQLNG